MSRLEEIDSMKAALDKEDAEMAVKIQINQHRRDTLNMERSRILVGRELEEERKKVSVLEKREAFLAQLTRDAICKLKEGGTATYVLDVIIKKLESAFNNKLYADD